MTTVPQTFGLALRYHQAGHFPQAAQLYQQILHEDPEHIESLHLLGLIYHQVGESELASAFLRQAVSLQPSHAEAHNNLGVALRQQGKLDEAITSYQQALHLEPAYAEAHNNLGNAFREQGKLAEAMASYRQALDHKPIYAEAHHNLGVVLREQGQLAEAVACSQQALRLKPTYAEAHYNLGVALSQQGQLAEAVACYQQAVRLKPSYAEAYNSLGVALSDQGQLAEAVACYQQALHLEPNYAEAHNNLGNAFQQQGQLAEAVACYQEAVRLQPRYAETHNNLGVALCELGQLEEAVACSQQALRLKPSYVEAYSNLGVALMRQGQLAEAVASYQQALRLKPHYADAHNNLGMAWLLLGNFAQGWAEYDWRWQCGEGGRPPFAQPLWDGSPLDGQTILLYAEQGLGDTLQFIRYVPSVRERGGRVLVACQPALVRLLADYPGIDRLIPKGSSLPPFDVYAPLLSLPGILKTSLATVPAQVPYLFADTQLIDSWRQELSAISDFRIGIAWDADPKFRRFNQQRCIPLADFAPLARREGVRLISLQKGPGAEQLRTVTGLFPVIDLGSRLDEASGAFMDSAAVMKNIDLVVTTDTSIAHLAGALGVPVWVALPFVPCWRWLLGREDSPWYPTMRLFRQTERGNWQGVFERMAQAVQQRLEKKGTQNFATFRLS